MSRILPLLVGLSLVASGATAQTPGVQGLWQSEGGRLDVSACPGSPRLCVTVLSGSASPRSMQDLVGQVIVRDLQRDRQGVWHGRFVGRGRNMAAEVRLQNASRATFRVCAVSWLPPTCRTQTITRLAQAR